MIDFIKLMDPSILRIEKCDECFQEDYWSLEPKINGRRIQSLVGDDISFAGRYGREAKENISDFRYKFSKIHDDIKKMGLPKNTLFDGEIHLKGKSVSLVHKILNSDLNDSITLQEQHGFLTYVIFDVMAIDGKWLLDCDLLSRKSKLSSLIDETCNIEIIKSINNYSEKFAYWKKLLKSNVEEKGVVFKFIDSCYEVTNKKSKYWRKLKEAETYDAVIIDFKFSTADPDNFVSSILVAQYKRTKLVEVASVSGLTREDANYFRMNVEKLKGKVIQFISETKTSSSYKNARFDCLRLDKSPRTCIWEENV